MAFVSLILEWESCGNAGNLKNKEEEKKEKEGLCLPAPAIFCGG